MSFVVPLSITMTIVSGVDLQIKERPRDQQLETMQKLTLKCAIVGAPQVNFRWTFQADDDPPRVLKDEESSIVIKNVSYSLSWGLTRYTA